MTVAAAVEVTFNPLRQRLHRWLDRVGPRTIRRFQWGYFLVSLAVLWWLLGFSEHHLGSLALAVVISAVYVAVALFLMAWLMPRDMWFAFGRRTSRLIKLAVVVNYLTALLLLQNLILTWRARAIILTMLFFTTWLGAWMLCRFLWPIHVQTVSILLSGGPQPFDIGDRQGRNIRSE